MTSETGPYLKAAAICSEVIEGKDGVLSLIRIIDRLTIAAGGSGAPEDMPPGKMALRFVLMLISGRAKGSHGVALQMESPDSQVKEVWTGTVFLEGEDRGANVIVQSEVEFSSEGLYWFDVYFDGTRLTRMPFRVIYQRVGTGTAPR